MCWLVRVSIKPKRVFVCAERRISSKQCRIEKLGKKFSGGIGLIEGKHMT